MTDHYQRALLLFQQSRFDLAERELRGELADNPDNPLAHAFLALCLVARKDYGPATRAAERAVELAPDLSFTHYALAQVLNARDHLDEAEAAVREAIRLDPEDADYYGLLANLHLQQRRWQAALDAAEQGLQLDPEDVECNNLRAMALVKLGRRQEAGATIEEALRKDPENAYSHANLGWMLLEKGDVPKAMEHFREALRLEPGMEWARLGIVEALKARHLIYRMMLWYFLWMAKLSGRAQWLIVLGLFFGYRAVRAVADNNPDLAPWVEPLLYLYIAFCFLSWTATPLFNLLLRLHRFGRLALSREEIVASNWVGAFLLLALACLVTYLVTDDPSASLGGMYFGLLILPVAATFNCPSGWPRQMMAGYTALLALVGLAAPALILLGSGLWLGAATVFGIGAVFSGFVGNALMGVRVKR